jgi:glyoxylase-like metal-dependent hydrolase (beta-lactamase superfamily II)
MTKIYAVEGNTQWLDGGSMFGNVPRALWERWVEVDDRNRIKLSCRALLIQEAGKNILCETGIGAFFDPKLADRFGVEESNHALRDNLEALGIPHDKIDFVIMSHLHFDHAGGLLPTYAEIQSGQTELLFPNAKYVVGQGSLERAENPHFRDRASYIPGLVEQLKESGRMVVVDENGAIDLPELSDRFSFRFSHGHTPGQMHTVFRGDQKTICFVGDLIPGCPWVHLPITMGYDRFPEKLIDEKQELYQSAEPEGWLLFYTHDAKCAASQVVKNAKGKYEATEMHTHLNGYEI